MNVHQDVLNALEWMHKCSKALEVAIEWAWIRPDKDNSYRMGKWSRLYSSEAANDNEQIQQTATILPFQPRIIE